MHKTLSTKLECLASGCSTVNNFYFVGGFPSSYWICNNLIVVRNDKENYALGGERERD